MSIQIDNGEFTRIHNAILDKLAKARFTALEYRCLIFLVRMTYGWQKKEDVLSLSQWTNGIGIDTKNRANILKTLNGLVCQGVIYTRSNGNNRPATWGLNKAYFENPTVMQPHNSIDDELEPTVMQPHNTSVMQPHNTSVMSGHNNLAETVMQPHNHKRKSKERSKKGERKGAQAPRPARNLPAPNLAVFKSPHVDNNRFALETGRIPSGAGQTPVEVYYERFDLRQNAARLNAIQEDDLVRLCPDLERLREVVTAYSRTNYQLGNLQLILDWYREGVPERHRGARASPGQSGGSNNGGVSAIMDYAQSKGMFQ